MQAQPTSLVRNGYPLDSAHVNGSDAEVAPVVQHTAETELRPVHDTSQQPPAEAFAVGLDGRPITITRYVPAHTARPAAVAGHQAVETKILTKRSHESMSAGQQPDVMHGPAGRIVTTSIASGQSVPGGHPLRPATSSADRAHPTSPAASASTRQVMMHPEPQPRPVAPVYPGHAVQVVDGVAYHHRPPPGTVYTYGPPPGGHGHHMYAPGPPVVTRVVARPMMHGPPGSHMHSAGYAPRPYGGYGPQPVHVREAAYAEPPHYARPVVTRPVAHFGPHVITSPAYDASGNLVEQQVVPMDPEHRPAGASELPQPQAHHDEGASFNPRSEVEKLPSHADGPDNAGPVGDVQGQEDQVGAQMDTQADDQRTESLPHDLPQQQQQQQETLAGAAEVAHADAAKDVAVDHSAPMSPVKPDPAAASDDANAPPQGVKQEHDASDAAVPTSQPHTPAEGATGSGIDRRPSHQASSGMGLGVDHQASPAMASKAATVQLAHPQENASQSDGVQHVDGTDREAVIVKPQQEQHAVASLTRSAEITDEVGVEGQQSAQHAQQLASRQSQVEPRHAQQGQEPHDSTHTIVPVTDEAQRTAPQNARHPGEALAAQTTDSKSVEYGAAREPGTAYAAPHQPVHHQAPAHHETVNHVLVKDVSPRDDGGAYEAVEYDPKRGHAGVVRKTTEELVTPNYAVAGGPAVHPLQYPGHMASHPQGCRYTPQPPHTHPPAAAAAAIPKPRPQHSPGGYVHVAAQEPLPPHAVRSGYAPHASHVHGMPPAGTVPPARGPAPRPGQTVVYEQPPGAQYAYAGNAPPPAGAIPVAPPQYYSPLEASHSPYPATRYVTTAIDPVTGQEVQYIYEDAPPPGSGVPYAEDPHMQQPVVYEAPPPHAPSHAPQQPVAMYEQKRLILEDGQEVIVYEPIEAPPPGAVVYETWPEEQPPHSRQQVMYETAHVPVMPPGPPRHRPGPGYGPQPTSSGAVQPPPGYYQPPPHPAGGHPPPVASYMYAAPPPGSAPSAAGKSYPYRPPAQYDYPPPPSYAYPPQAQPAGNAAPDDQKYGYLRRPKRIRPDQICAACGSRSTPQWRTGENNEMLCNACGLRFRKVKQVKDGKQPNRGSSGQDDPEQGNKPSLDVPPY